MVERGAKPILKTIHEGRAIASPKMIARAAIEAMREPAPQMIRATQDSQVAQFMPGSTRDDFTMMRKRGAPGLTPPSANPETKKPDTP
jgi:hypothetical protein